LLEARAAPCRSTPLPSHLSKLPCGPSRCRSHSPCSEELNCCPILTPNPRYLLYATNSCHPRPRSASTASHRPPAENLPMQAWRHGTRHSRPMMSGFSVCHPSPPLPHVSHEIGVAEMLAKSVTFQDRNDECFTPSNGIDDESAYAYDYEYNSDEEFTILSTWCIVKRASLPIDTFCLASLILQELGPRFYRRWLFEMDVLYRGRHHDRTRELIIVAACVCSRVPPTIYLRSGNCPKVPTRRHLHPGNVELRLLQAAV